MKLLLIWILSVASLKQCQALTCYACEEPCDTSTAKEVPCDVNSTDQNSACLSIISKDDHESALATRQCHFFGKDELLTCPIHSICTYCNTTLCNGGSPRVEPSTTTTTTTMNTTTTTTAKTSPKPSAGTPGGVNMETMGVIAACLFTLLF